MQKKSIFLYQMFLNFFSDASLPLVEMGIYRDNLSAIIYYRLSLSLKIVLIYRLPISLL